MILCPRRPDGRPDHKAETPPDYLTRLAVSRGLPYPVAKQSARAKRG